jgi:hypothetical protein
METSVVFEQKIAISPREFNTLGTSKIDDVLLKRFAEENEGRCSVHGWVVPGTLKMLSRTMLQIEGGRFTGDMVCWIQVEGKVIYPVDGITVQGFVLNNNKMGLVVMHKDNIKIMVPRDLHIDNEEFDDVQVGEQVEVIIKKSRFQVKDETILSVGLFVRRVAGGIPAVAPPKFDVDTDEEEEVEMPPLEPLIEETSGQLRNETEDEEEDETDDEMPPLEPVAEVLEMEE